MIFKKIDASLYCFVSKIHIEAFKDFFLTTLGVSFLDSYYKSCLKSKDWISVGAFNDDDVLVGFAIGTVLSNGFHKNLLRDNFFEFCIQAIKLLFTKPVAIIRLAKNLSKNKNSDMGNYSELLSIGVLNSSKGLGIGKTLILHFELEAASRGCSRIALTTDGLKNDVVINFYTNNGYDIFYEFLTFPDRKMYKMIKNLI